MEEDPNPTPSASSQDKLAQNSGKPKRKGQKLFWWLLFLPAVLAIVTGPSAFKGEDWQIVTFYIALGIGALICIYCGFWTARGRMHSRVNYVLGGILMSLAYILINLAISFAGCLAILG